MNSVIFFLLDYAILDHIKLFLGQRVEPSTLKLTQKIRLNAFLS